MNDCRPKIKFIMHRKYVSSIQNECDKSLGKQLFSTIAYRIFRNFSTERNFFNKTLYKFFKPCSQSVTDWNKFMKPKTDTNMKFCYNIGWFCKYCWKLFYSVSIFISCFMIDNTTITWLKLLLLKFWSLSSYRFPSLKSL